MQPYFFPYLGYWQLINTVDKYVIYDDVAYIKGGWISRNNILLGGNKHLITLPLDNPSSFRNINEIDITSNIKQREKILRTLDSAYKKAPYYSTVINLIEPLIMDCKGIAELNAKAIEKICDYLKIDTEIVLSSSIIKNNELKGQDKVIDINKRLGSNIYINAIGGKELYSKDVFNKEHIELKFLKMGEIKYKQYSDDFVGGLSIIDVLMFNSKEEVNRLLDIYTLE